MRGRSRLEQTIHLQLNSYLSSNTLLRKVTAQPDSKYVIYFYLTRRPLHIEQVWRAEGEEKEQ